MSRYGQIGQLSVLATPLVQPHPQMGQVALLASTGERNSRWADHSQVVVLASVNEERTVSEVSEVALLVSYTEGPRETFNSRAWGFTFDGHPFYVMHLGNTGTWVFDVSTEQWAQWATEGITTWNMEYGTEWNGEVVAGDQQTNDVWRLNPDSFLDDDFRPIRRIATAGYPITGRDAVSMGILTLETSAQLDLEVDATVTLSISDDKGKSFNPLDTLVITDDDQDLSWRSLGSGKQPGRVFRIEDFGGLVRIDGAELTLNKPRTKDKSG